MPTDYKNDPEVIETVYFPASPMAASVSVPTSPARWRSFGDSLKIGASRGGWALGDQAVVSLGNYVTLIIVARNLADAQQLGTFGILLNILLFLNSLQQGIVIYPMLVNGAALDDAGMQRLAGGALILTGILAVPLSLAMLGVSAYFGGRALLLCVPLAMIFAQLQETIRRSMLAHLRFAAAIPGDALSYLGQAIVLLMLGRRLTLPLTFTIMAGTSALAAIVQALQMGPRGFPISQLRGLVQDFWKLGSWVFFANLGGLVTNNSYELVLYRSWGAMSVGYLNAIAFTMKLINPLAIALSGLIVPSVARARARAGTRVAMRLGLKYAAFGVAAMAIYFGILAVFPEVSLHLFFGKNHPDYVQKLPAFLRGMVCVWGLAFVINMIVAILNGLGYSRANFLTTLANGIVTLLISLPLIYAMGLKGVVIGGALATVTATVVAFVCLIRHHE